jgi:hypothetical protein
LTFGGAGAPVSAGGGLFSKLLFGSRALQAIIRCEARFPSSIVVRDQQRASFGDRASRIGRQVIVQTVEEYARSTQNYLMLNLLQRLMGRSPAEPPATPGPVIRCPPQGR